LIGPSFSKDQHPEAALRQDPREFYARQISHRDRYRQLWKRSLGIRKKETELPVLLISRAQEGRGKSRT